MSFCSQLWKMERWIMSNILKIEKCRFCKNFNHLRTDTITFYTNKFNDIPLETKYDDIGFCQFRRIKTYGNNVCIYFKIN